MDAESLVLEHFAESLATKKAAANVLAPPIARAGQLMAQSLLDDGKIFSSLSEIANTITGAHWSGPRFFGLKKKPSLTRQASR